MKPISKKDRKMYNEHVRDRNESLRAGSGFAALMALAGLGLVYWTGSILIFGGAIFMAFLSYVMRKSGED